MGKHQVFTDFIFFLAKWNKNNRRGSSLREPILPSVIRMYSFQHSEIENKTYTKDEKKQGLLDVKMSCTEVILTSVEYNLLRFKRNNFQKLSATP